MPTFAERSLAALLEATAAKTPTPGGGAVASITGALAAALAQMVVSYSLGKKNLAEHQGALAEAATVLTNARAMFLRLADEDAAAYATVNELQKLPEGSPGREGLPAALEAAVVVPLTTIGACVDTLRLMESLAGTTNRHLRSDLGIAAVLADAAACASMWNVRINAGFMTDAAKRDSLLASGEALLRKAAAQRARVEAACAV